MISHQKQSIIDYFSCTYLEVIEDNYRTYITRNNFLHNAQEYDYKIVLHDNIERIVDIYIPSLLEHLKDKSITAIKFKNTKTPPIKKYSWTLNTFIVYVPKRPFSNIHNVVKNLTTKTPLIIDVATITDPERL